MYNKNYVQQFNPQKEYIQIQNVVLRTKMYNPIYRKIITRSISSTEIKFGIFQFIN